MRSTSLACPVRASDLSACLELSVRLANSREPLRTLANLAALRRAISDPRKGTPRLRLPAHRPSLSCDAQCVAGESAVPESLTRPFPLPDAGQTISRSPLLLVRLPAALLRRPRSRASMARPVPTLVRRRTRPHVLARETRPALLASSLGASSPLFSGTATFVFSALAENFPQRQVYRRTSNTVHYHLRTIERLTLLRPMSAERLEDATTRGRLSLPTLVAIGSPTSPTGTEEARDVPLSSFYDRFAPLDALAVLARTPLRPLGWWLRPLPQEKNILAGIRTSPEHAYNARPRPCPARQRGPSQPRSTPTTLSLAALRSILSSAVVEPASRPIASRQGPLRARERSVP